MENKKLAVICGIIIIIVVILSLTITGILNNEKENTNIEIIGNSTLEEGNPITIKLSSDKGEIISNENISISLVNANGTITNYTAVTNNNGEASIGLDTEPGQYTINIKYSGNSKYNESELLKQITITGINSNNDSESEIDKNRPSSDNPNYKGNSKVHHESEEIDGWNPSEHEVSRESIGDGKERITYDDGYFRIVDSNGYVITYGY